MWPDHLTTYQLCDWTSLASGVAKTEYRCVRDTARWSACLPHRRPLHQYSMAANTHEKMKGCFRIRSLACSCRLEAPILTCTCNFFFQQHIDNTDFSGKLLHVSARLGSWTSIIQHLSKCREIHFTTEKTSLPWKRKLSR